MISVIIPVYNAIDTLECCINSILRQTVRDYEIILIDDGSDDGSALLCDKYAKLYSNISVIHLVNSGPSMARNTGMESAMGDYFCFVDSDDQIKPDLFEKVLPFTEKYDWINYSYCKQNESGELLEHVKFDVGEYHLPNECCILDVIARKYFAYGFGFEVWNKLFKKDIINKNNIRFDACLRVGEDLAFCLCYLMCCKTLLTIDYEGYCYTVRENSIMRSAEQVENLGGMVKVSKSVYEFASQKHKNIILWNFSLIHYYIINGQMTFLRRRGQKFQTIRRILWDLDEAGFCRKMFKEFGKRKKIFQIYLGTTRYHEINNEFQYYICGNMLLLKLKNRILYYIENRK